MNEKSEVRQGALAIMALKTLDVLGPQHGNLLSINHGTLYPVLLKLEQEGIAVGEAAVGADHGDRGALLRLRR